MKKDQEEQETKLMEFQILNNQFEKYREQLINFQAQKQNLDSLTSTFKEISKLKQDSEILSPLSSGILVKTSLKNPDEVFITVGANVVVKKNLKDAQEFIEVQNKQVILIISQLESQLMHLGQAINNIQKEIS